MAKEKRKSNRDVISRSEFYQLTQTLGTAWADYVGERSPLPALPLEMAQADDGPTKETS